MRHALLNILIFSLVALALISSLSASGREMTPEFAEGFRYGQHVLTDTIENACDTDGRFEVAYGNRVKKYTCRPVTI